MSLIGLSLSLVLPFWEDKSPIRKPSRPQSRVERVVASRAPVTITVGGTKPRRWCGWYMRQLKGVKDPAFNRARMWARWGSPVSGPTVGAVVVWKSHVGLITGVARNGNWIVLSGNDSNRVRERPRSVKGAIAFRV